MTGYDRITLDHFGGPEVLRLEHVASLPEPGEGEVRIRVEAAGVGYTDTIVRRGWYPACTEPPLTPGYDVVGIIDQIGPGVTGFTLGTRVADMPVHGAYSQYMISPARDLVAVPAGVSPAAAVDVPLMWVTAWQMLTRLAVWPDGSSILVVGAGGAVGRALVMLARHLGHVVIGTCSGGNLAAVQAMGAMAIDYGHPNLAAAIRQAAGSNGIAAAFDAIGGTSWETSWQALGQNGLLVGYGLQDHLDSGAAEGEAAKMLHRITTNWDDEGQRDGSNRRSIFYDIRLRRISHPEEYREDASHLLALMADAKLLPPPAEILPLSEAAEAHRRIAGGGLSRRLVLQP